MNGRNQKAAQNCTFGIRRDYCRHIRSLHNLSIFASYDGSVKNKLAVGTVCCYKFKIVHFLLHWFPLLVEFGFFVCLPNGAKLFYSLVSEKIFPEEMHILLFFQLLKLSFFKKIFNVLRCILILAQWTDQAEETLWMDLLVKYARRFLQSYWVTEEKEKRQVG